MRAGCASEKGGGVQGRESDAEEKRVEEKEREEEREEKKSDDEVERC